MNDDERYVVAVRRDRRDRAPHDWLDQISGKGAAVVGGWGDRAQIIASLDVAERIRAEMGDFLLIEPVNEHRTLMP